MIFGRPEEPLRQQANCRSFEQRQFRQLLAGKSLSLHVQVDREKGIAAHLKEIIVHGDVLGFQKLPPERQ